jgi:hypothetical protein
MSKKTKLFQTLFGLYIIASLLLTGCASGPKFTAAPAPQPGNALIYVYRTSGMVGAANHPDIYVNGQFLAPLINGSYAVREVPQGTVVFHELYRHIRTGSLLDIIDALDKKHERLRLEVEAGKTYYVRWNYDMKLEDEATGIQQIGGLRLATE